MCINGEVGISRFPQAVNVPLEHSDNSTKLVLYSFLKGLYLTSPFPMPSGILSNIGGSAMYKLQVLTHQDHVVATFAAGRTLCEANIFYADFVRSGLYEGYCFHITL